EHLELPVFRVEYFDPAMDVKNPTGDSGARDLNQTNPTWGYIGYVIGANYFLNHKHTLKAQASYEIRNETKQCARRGELQDHHADPRPRRRPRRAPPRPRALRLRR